MTEFQFLKKNTHRWKEAEAILAIRGLQKPDAMATHYILISEDLAFSRTYFPGSKTTTYLNHLTSRFYNYIYRTKPENRNRFVRFWTSELPFLMNSFRPEIRLSLVIFVLASVYGVLASFHFPGFPATILGADYVSSTIQHIRDGNPLAVYDQENLFSMWISIAFNNIRVTILTYLGGLFLGFGTGFILIKNGIMVGAFHALFYGNGVGTESVIGIWIHGTLELSCIVLAGAAGLRLFRSFWFPGTFPRRHSFMNGSREGLKLIIGIAPVLIVAAALESVVTRYYQVSILIPIICMVLSSVFIFWYFFLYPTLTLKEPHGKPDQS